MTSNSEYDIIGELFRQRLENHRIPVDDNDWDEIERRLGKRKKNKAIIWLWSVGAAAAAVAALLIISRPQTDEVSTMTVSQQITPEETNDLNPDNSGQGFKNSRIQRFKDSKIQGMKDSNPELDSGQGFKNSKIQRFKDSKIQGKTDSNPELDSGQLLDDSITLSFNDSVTHSFDDLVIAEKEIPKLDASLVEDRPEEDEADTKKTDKWLLAAAFGIGGQTNGFSDTKGNPMANPSIEMGLSGSDNRYATDKANSVQSFSYMSRNDFTNISHLPPLSFGVTARKNLGKGIGVESGLVYTYLASRFEWSGYDVRQSLHYVGIPVNMVVYLWNSNPNWRVYLSGGAMAEKGMRAIYRQEMQGGEVIRTTTVKSSSIDGWQWSLNGALGLNYRLEKGWGIYFEPRVGYSFDCNQPVSIRTEWPVYFGIHLGLNFEL